jgi:hypothetical protein
MREIRTPGSMSGDGKPSVAVWPRLPPPVLDSTGAAEGWWAEDIDKKGNTGDILRLSSLKR